MVLVLNAVLPVFLLAALGYFLFRIGFITRDISVGLNQLVYWVGLPSLLFHKISRQQLEWSSVSDVLSAFFLALAGTVLLAYVISWFLRIDAKSLGAFVQAAYRGNLGFIGLPIVLYSFSQGDIERSEAIAAISLAPCAIAFNIIAVALMIAHQPKTPAKRPRFLFFFLTNPLIVGGVLGVTAASLELDLPLFVDRSFEGLSNMSVPVALLGLGASLGFFGIKEFKRDLVVAIFGTTLLKILVSPLLGVVMSVFLVLDFVEARIVVIYLATPTAIASNVIVGQFGGDEKLAASSIVSATLGSILFLPLALWITGEQTWGKLLQLAGH
ncbi:MAG: AEC family transporter [Planctomycetota bacterium]|nr:AEC family transporter [Planctomycetota bacterium]